MKTGIYIHVPFCRSKCSYCDFYSESPDGNSEQINRYIEYVKADIKQTLEQDQLTSIETVYFGGGTPSLLSPVQIEKLLEPLKDFIYPGRCEISLEMNPEDVHASYIESLSSLGVNRIILGLQNCDEKALETIGRSSQNPYKPLLDIFFSQSGFTRGVDIIAGIPGQSNESLKSTLDIITQYQPEHLSVYLLTLKENTSLYEKFTEDQEFTQHQVEQYYLIKEHMEQKAYKHYEVSSFSLPGYESLHNSRYWTLDNYHGFGPSSHSYVNGKRYWCSMSVNEYCSKRPVVYTYDDRHEMSDLVEYVMTGLRLIDGFSFHEYRLHSGKIEPVEVVENLRNDSRIITYWVKGKELYRVSESCILHADAIAYDICEPWIE